MNTVYILGAGASRGAGIPQMTEFLQKAEKIKEIMTLRNDFDKLSKYLNGLKISKNPNISDETVFSLEEVLGCLDMEEYTGNKNPDAPDKESLLNIIFKTIVFNLPAYKALKERHPDLCNSDGNDEAKYEKTIQKFVKQLAIGDTIISLNYDVIIDYYLHNNGIAVDYGFPLERIKKITNSGKRISLLKLHGSLNWRSCPKCQETEELNFDVFFEKSKPTDKGLNELFLHIIIPCLKHKRPKFIPKDILIVPPTWYKTGYPYEIIKTIWRKASEKLENAEKMIFIGYSFPQTDIHFKYLLLSSLAKNKNKFSVEVIDPKIQNTAGRYLEIFKDNISFKAMTFEDYVLNNC